MADQPDINAIKRQQESMAEEQAPEAPPDLSNILKRLAAAESEIEKIKNTRFTSGNGIDLVGGVIEGVTANLKVTWTASCEKDGDGNPTGNVIIQAD